MRSIIFTDWNSDMEFGVLTLQRVSFSSWTIIPPPKRRDAYVYVLIMFAFIRNPVNRIMIKREIFRLWEKVIHLFVIGGVVNLCKYDYWKQMIEISYAFLQTSHHSTHISWIGLISNAVFASYFRCHIIPCSLVVLRFGWSHTVCQIAGTVKVTESGITSVWVQNVLWLYIQENEIVNVEELPRHATEIRRRRFRRRFCHR